MSGNLYTDEETKKMEKQILNFFPNFNKSSFYKQALADFINNNIAGIETLKKKVEEEKQIQENSKKREIHFQSLVENYSEREKEKIVLKQKQEKISKKVEKEFILNTINVINQFFPEISNNFSSDKVLSLAKEFFEKSKTDKIQIADFLKLKGYKIEEEISQ